MPQLDQLIWINLCLNNTLFFWIIYYIVIRIVLLKSNILLYIRNGLKEDTFINIYIKINSIYFNNFEFIKNEIINIFFFNKRRFILNIFNLFGKYKDIINNNIFSISHVINNNNYLFTNNYYYFNYYFYCTKEYNKIICKV